MCVSLHVVKRVIFHDSAGYEVELLVLLLAYNFESSEVPSAFASTSNNTRHPLSLWPPNRNHEPRFSPARFIMPNFSLNPGLSLDGLS